MKHATTPTEPAPAKDCGVRDSVETAIDLAKGLDLESWEQRLREEPGRIPKWGGRLPCTQPEPPPQGATKAARVASRASR